MKRLVVSVFILGLIAAFATSCDRKNIRQDAHENYSAFQLENFSGKASFKMKRTGLDDGEIYYRSELSQGELTIRYDLGLIHDAQELATLSVSAQPIDGWGGYVFGDTVTIIFEADEVVNGEVIIGFLPFAVYPDNLQKHEHTYEWETTEETHQIVYTCGCSYPDIAEFHLDEDEDGNCDRCDYFVGLLPIPKPESNLLRDRLGAEWLYQVRVDQIAEITMTIEAISVKPGNLKYLDRTKNEELIGYIFDAYYRLEILPISLEEGQIEGGSLLTVQFHLKDGSMRELLLNNGTYCENNTYYRPLYLPTISDYYDSPAEVYIESGYLFITIVDKGSVYLYDGTVGKVGEKVCEISGMGSLAFVCEWVDGCIVPTHIIETEFGMLEVYGEQYFRYQDAIYRLIDGNFYEIFENGVIQ